MSKEIIKKIVIEIAGKEISLTPKQATELSDALNTLLGKPAYTYYPYTQGPIWYSYLDATSNPNLDMGKITIS